MGNLMPTVVEMTWDRFWWHGWRDDNDTGVSHSFQILVSSARRRERSAVWRSGVNMMTCNLSNQDYLNLLTNNTHNNQRQLFSAPASEKKRRAEQSWLMWNPRMLFDMNDLIKALETGKSHQSCQQKEIQPNTLHDIKDPYIQGLIHHQIWENDISIPRELSIDIFWYSHTGLMTFTFIGALHPPVIRWYVDRESLYLPDISHKKISMSVLVRTVIYILVYFKYFSSKLKPKPITHRTTTP